MCGITGFIGRVDDPIQTINLMKGAIAHRGPDSSNYWIDESNFIALGHQRLAILDVSEAGSQPMLSPSSKYVIVYNGEIYNHLELRKELEELSDQKIIWKGKSDTETLVVSLDLLGIEKTLKKCLGMFAIAIWNQKSKKLTLARDRAGEKPLYYGWVNNKFVFASELKSIRQFPEFANPISKEALVNYLHVNYVPAPYSIYEDIFKLNPGSLIEIDASNGANNLPIEKFFWSFLNVASDGIKHSFEKGYNFNPMIEKTIENAVNSQMISDVPLGAFLSGGIDSSLIVALMQKNSMQKIKTFTIGFENKLYDESPYAAEIAKHIGTDHTSMLVTEHDAMSVIPSLGKMYDEPFSDSSQIPMHLVSLAAKKHVTVALSGDGGDELFGGYNRYTHTKKIWNKASRLPFFIRKRLSQLALKIPANYLDYVGSKFFNINEMQHFSTRLHKLAERFIYINSLEDLCVNLASNWTNPELLVKGMETKDKNYIKLHSFEFNQENDEITNMMLLDSLTYLPDDILCKIDRAAMAISLETRVPFLDPQVISAAWRISLDDKIKNQEGKQPLRDILRNYVPSNLFERPKTGFAIPIGDWLRGPLLDWCEELINEKKLIKQNIFNVEHISRMWKEHKTGKNDWTSKLWSIVIFQIWLEENHPEM
jgi:asparagine synthase (glutamine-hydrolysing)